MIAFSEMILNLQNNQSFMNLLCKISTMCWKTMIQAQKKAAGYTSGFFITEQLLMWC